MQLTNLFDENDGSRAVSPVIGVILMVAITVILAAVIGTFVLGLGDSVESTPQASINYDYSPSDDSVDIRHRGGDDLNPDELELRINGTVISASTPPVNNIAFDSDSGAESFADVADNPFTAGSSVEIDAGGNGIGQGTQIDLVFIGGERGSIIASFEVPRSSDSY